MKKKVGRQAGRQDGIVVFFGIGGARRQRQLLFALTFFFFVRTMRCDNYRTVYQIKMN
jgi:hypothetical protein